MALVQLCLLALRAGRMGIGPEGASEYEGLATPVEEPARRPAAGRKAAPIAAAAAAPNASRQTDEIYGRVVDPEGRPLAARVVLRAPDGRHFEAQGDAEGGFRFSGIDAEEFSVEALHPGFRAQRLEGLAPGAEVRIELTRGSGLRGRVVDLAGRGVAGAFVEARGSGGYLELRRTDEDGRYEIPRPASGMLSFTVAAPGHDLLETSRVPVRAEDDAIEDWALGEGIAFFARIVDARTGEPIAGARLALEPAGMLAADDLRRRAYPPAGIADREGAFRCDGLPRGGALLAIAAAGYTPIAQTLRIDESVRGEQRFALERGRSVRGRVEARGGASLWEVSLEQLHDLGQWSAVGGRVPTDAEGRFELAGAPADRPLRVVVWQGKVRAKVSESIAPGAQDASSVRIALE
jgi:hypothetical protein